MALLFLPPLMIAQQADRAKLGAADFARKLKAAEESAKAKTPTDLKAPANPAAADNGSIPQSSTPVTSGTTGNDELMERIWCGDVTDQLTRDTCWKAYQARMNYYIRAMDHRTSVFWWQKFASRVIFFVVIGLVFVGLYFAWVQFRKDLLTGSVARNELELATSGIKVSSPVLGVIILTLSLAFFYLYLRYVFPITNTF